ncbi:MAG: hypothetical protein R3268_15100, partial [Acidiferrobacterales bacterium]|nr:hypothetical protein [Acidiferrobacterales bacterium]
TSPTTGDSFREPGFASGAGLFAFPFGNDGFQARYETPLLPQDHRIFELGDGMLKIEVPKLILFFSNTLPEFVCVQVSDFFCFHVFLLLTRL